jgi:two-component system OmpR family sensor kinase
MRSFRVTLAVRVAISAFVLFLLVGGASLLALRTILYRQLDGTLLHIAEVEAQAGAATSGPAFEVHEGVLLAARESPIPELTRYAQLWTSEGAPLVRSRNLAHDLILTPAALAAARRGEVAWDTHEWRDRTLRCVLYPLKLVGAAHGVHVLQIAAPVEPLRGTLNDFGLLVLGLTVVATAVAGFIGWRLAGAALRPTAEITAQAEAVEEGTLSTRITAHAEVEEFSRLVAVVNAMLDRLDRAFQAQRRFTADASHELRAPLTALRGEIEVALKRDRPPEEYRQVLGRCRDEVIHLSKLASDLLTLARSEAGQLIERLQETDVFDVAERVERRFTTLARSRNVTLTLTGEPAVVQADPQVLECIIGNLIDNAVKHTPDGGRVSVAVTNGDAATVEVRDTGPGIPASDAAHLFERFFRADPARPRIDGSGLGLAIAYAGARAHQGTLEFLGNDPGAVFRLRLPARPSLHRL